MNKLFKIIAVLAFLISIVALFTPVQKNQETEKEKLSRIENLMFPDKSPAS